MEAYPKGERCRSTTSPVADQVVDVRLPSWSADMLSARKVRQRRFATADRAPQYRTRARVRGIGTKGLLANWQTLCGIFEDKWTDWRHGPVTASGIESSNIRVQAESARYSQGYGATRRRHVRKVLRGLPIPLGSVFVDVGCGAGRVLLLACEYPFARVVGIELSPWLRNLARANVTALEQRVVIVPEVELVVGDVVDYEIRPDENVFFMCDPFRGVVMERFLRNLSLSLERCPRTAWLLYNNPVEHDRVMSVSSLTTYGRVNYGGGTIAVYSNAESESPED